MISKPDWPNQYNTVWTFFLETECFTKRTIAGNRRPSLWYLAYRQMLLFMYHHL